MKNRFTYLAVFAALLIGFTIAWFIKPIQHQNIAASQHQTKDQDYTCSMHPQIRQNEPGLCPICEMDLILVGENASDDPLVLEMTKEAVKLSNIQTTTIGESGKVEKVISLTGKIKTDERLTASQVAHIPGRIEQLFVTFTGDRVKKGQKLATIYSPELLAAQGELLEAAKFQDVNNSLLEAARNKLRYWKIPDAIIEEIEKSGKIKETFLLYAEAEGYVANHRVSVGDYVRQGQVLFDIVNLKKLWVLFDAYEEELASIQVGDRVEFTTPALPDKTFSTRISFIDPLINPQTRVASIRGEIINTRRQLKPEMFVRGNLRSIVSQTEQLLVPKSAVLWTGVRSVVYVKLPDLPVPSFQYREVVLGKSLGKNYLIESGLEAGEEVVTYGNFAIDAAAQLNNQQSMMNKVVRVKGEQMPEVPDYIALTPDALKTQLQQLTKEYIDLKDAFVETNSEIAATAGDAFLKQLEKIDMALLNSEAADYWLKQQSGMKNHAEKLVSAVDVERQRLQFGYLSNLLIQSVQAFGINGDALFIQHCPMAFDDEGADWLSLDEDILNPYFGDKMLRCGYVKDILKY